MMGTILLILLLVGITAVNVWQTRSVRHQMGKIHTQLEEIVVRLHFLRLEYKRKNQ